MNGIWIDGPVVVAVTGLLAKELVSLLKRGRNGKGNGRVEALLSDIKGQGGLMLGKVQEVKEAQGLIEGQVAVIAESVKGFNERCRLHMEMMGKKTDELTDRVNDLGGRVFDLQGKVK